jgi:uncharacterized protein YjdB
MKTTNYMKKHIVRAKNVLPLLLAAMLLMTACAEKEEAVDERAIGVTLDITALEIEMEQVEQLTAIVEPDNVADKTVTWSTSNKTIALVNQQGEITGMGLGKAVITAATANGKKARCTVLVHLPWPTQIQLDQTALSLFIGESGTLTTTLLPEGSDRTITWSSSDEAIATVSETGEVFAWSFGSATITATTHNGLQATCALTVNKKAPTGVQMAPEVYLAIGYTEKLTATVLPYPGASQEVTWSSSNPAIVSINATTGEATGVALGSAVITATVVDDQSITTTCTATVSLMNQLTLTGYTAANIVITYTDNSTMTLPVHDEQAMLVHSTRTIKSLTPAGGSPILIGRKADSDISLKFVAGTSLTFRDADADGFIPISTYAEFQRIGSGIAGKYKLEANLDLMSESWTPITNFSGTFDGGGHTLANLYSTSNGLFTNFHGTLKNLGIVSGFVSGNDYVGAFVGNVNSGTASISGCFNNASVTGTAHSIGGIIGGAFGGQATVTACYNTGAVTSIDHWWVGGIAGYSITAIACYNTGVITGDGRGNTGGIVAQAGTKTACYVKDPVNTGGGTAFSATAWPSTAANAEWGTGDGSGSGKYWKDLGGWNGGSPTYPKLFFE